MAAVAGQYLHGAMFQAGRLAARGMTFAVQSVPLSPAWMAAVATQCLHGAAGSYCRAGIEHVMCVRLCTSSSRSAGGNEN